MNSARHWPLDTKVVCHLLPVDTNGNAQGGNYIFTSLRLWPTLAVKIAVGVHSGNAAAVTLSQAKNVEGNGSKALGFSAYYQMQPNTSPPEHADRWDVRVATSNTFDLIANTIFVIPVKQAMLDVTNKFDCVRLAIVAPSAATLIYAEMILLNGPTALSASPGSIKHVPSANVNKMPNS